MLNDRILIPIVRWCIGNCFLGIVASVHAEERSDAAFAKHSADYYSTGYQKREMDALGMLSSEIMASKMVHYNDDGTVHMEAPKMSFFMGNHRLGSLKRNVACFQATAKNYGC